jgi:hypothetical protein
MAREPALKRETSPIETHERRTISGTQRINLDRPSRAPTLPAPASLPSIDLFEVAEKNAAAVVKTTKQISTGAGDAVLLFLGLLVTAAAVTWFAALFFP